MSTESTESVYDGYLQWKGWDKLFAVQPYEVKLFDREFSGIPLKGRRLLDVGFGAGSLLDWARKRGADVEGVEVQAELREAALRQGVIASASLEELGDGRYDIVTLFDILEHIPRDAIPLVLQTLHRIVRPGGRIVIRVPNCQSPLGLLNQLGDATHVTMLSGPVVSQLLQQAGFHVVAVREAVSPNPAAAPLKRLFKPLQRMLQALFKLAYRAVWSTGATPLSVNVIVHADRP